MAPSALESRRPAGHAHRERTSDFLAELYMQSSAVVERHYRRQLTLAMVARALASSPRQLQRAYEEIGHTSFSAQLTAVRLACAAELLARQPLCVRDVARLVGYRQAPHFAKAFRRRYGLSPAQYRAMAREREATAPSTHRHGGQAR